LKAREKVVHPRHLQPHAVPSARAGKGAQLFDAERNARTGTSSAESPSTSSGISNPKLVKVLREEIGLAAAPSRTSSTTRRRGFWGERLVRESGLLRAFFCNSGTEAK